MLMIIPASCVGFIALLLCILPAESAFNWDHLGGPPPESPETIAFDTVTTNEPTPRWARRIKEFLKRNRPQHVVEMLYPENKTALAEEHKEIKRNMTLDPSWAWRKYKELEKLKGTTIDRLDDAFKNFTFPDMNIGTYDCSKTDEDFNQYLDKVTIETDYHKLKAKYDPLDLLGNLNNKSVDWGEPTYDDEEFDQFVQQRIGRLLMSVYSMLGRRGTQVATVVESISAITRDIITTVEHAHKYLNTDQIFKRYFLNNVLVECDKLERVGLVSGNFAKLVERVVQQFARLDLNQIEKLLENIANQYENIINLVNTLVRSDPNIEESIETIVKTLVSPFEKKDNTPSEVLGKLENILKPLVESYDHSVEVNVKADKNHEDSRVKGEKSDMSHVQRITNIINIFINRPREHGKKRRSILQGTTTYLPPWDPEKEFFPRFTIPGLSGELFNALGDSFQMKKRDAWERHMKAKIGKPNNNSESSFIFETWEYENPNKTRISNIARQKNIEKIREESNKKKDMRKGNKTYEAMYMARREEHRARQMNLTKNKEPQKQQNPQREKQQNHQREKQENSQKEKQENSQKEKQEKPQRQEENRKVERQTACGETTNKQRRRTLQDISDIDAWLDEGEKHYSRLPLETTRAAKVDDRKSIDESYERYKKRKERRRKQKELSRRRYDDSEDRSRSRSCEHCNRRRHRKHRKYAKSSSESDYTESESSRRDRRRKRKYRYRSDSSESRRKHRKYRSSESESKSISRETKSNKQKRSYDDVTSPTTSSTTTSKTTTKRKSTKKQQEEFEYAEDEPSEPISDVPSHELTSWHYWKDWSLRYFIHQNLSDYNVSTNNIWKTTWPWTTKKVRITKWRHPNVSWAPMSDSDSRSSQDSYEWGSGQSWIQNQKRELKSVEHFVRDNLFSEINEAASRMNKMHRSYSFESKDQDLMLSENEERMQDFSARYKQEFRKKKMEEKEKEMEYQKWSLSGGNYSTTTEFDWLIKVTKNFTMRSFRKGGHDIVFDISGLTLDPLSLEQIEKNLDADYLWKYGKNRTNTSTLPTTTPTSTTTTPSTTTQSTTTQSTTTRRTTKQSVRTGEASQNEPMEVINNHDQPLYGEGKSLVNSEAAIMSSKEIQNKLTDFENNFNNYELEGHQMFGAPAAAQRKRRAISNKNKIQSMMKQVMENKMSVEDFYVNNKKPKMLFLQEIPTPSPKEIHQKELHLQSQLNGFLQDTQNQQHIDKKIAKSRKIAKRFRRAIGQRVKRAIVPEPEGKPKTLDLKDFNQGKDPEHPIFILTDEDVETKRYLTYNASFINDKLHEYIDDMFEDLKINHDTSEEEKRANSIYYRKYVEKRTTEFFKKLEEVLAGDDKRAIENFTYPPDYDFDAVSVRDPKKEPYLMELKNEYQRQHAKSMEELKRDIALHKAGKLCTKKWREEAEAHVRGLPDDDE